MEKKKAVAILLSIAIIGTTIAGVAFAASSKEENKGDSNKDGDEQIIGPKYVYAAKYVCGDGGYSNGAVAPAKYHAAINVHNPQNYAVTVYKKVVQALPENKIPLPPSLKRQYSIKSDYAFEIDCADIKQIGGITGPFSKGFVVIESPKPIDVVGVYTSTNPTGITYDIEEVTPKYVS